MNLILKGNGGFYVASIRRSGDGFESVGRRISEDGRILAAGGVFRFDTDKEARAKARDMIKTKILKRGWVPVQASEVPESVARLMYPPIDCQLTIEEAIGMILRQKSEKYVIFSDVAGIGAYFDVGVEYIGYDAGESLIDVVDNFGQIRRCMTSRIAATRPTEEAGRAWGLLDEGTFGKNKR
jgi:hypothetical protein